MIPDAEAEEEEEEVTKAGVFTAVDSRRRLGGTSDHHHLLHTEAPVATATDWLDGGAAPALIVLGRLLFLHFWIV